jgi:hypothetical protein
MNNWINLGAVWQIVVVGLLAGAGLPAIFAIGIRALGAPGKGHVTAAEDELVGGSPAGIALAVVCFAIVATGIGYGIYIVVASGHK